MAAPRPSELFGRRTERVIEEVGVDAKPKLAALLRVELRGDQIIAGNHGCKLHSVVRLANYGGAVVGICVVAVDEIEIGSIGNAAEYRMRLELLDLIPTHVRHLLPAGQPANGAVQNVEAALLAILFTGRQQRLQ